LLEVWGSSRTIAVPFSDGTGFVNRHADFASRHIAPRHVDVWCPPGVATTSASRYPVIYMHDGQNLFDPALSFIGVDWGMDEAMTRLIRDTGHPGAIIVGIWNSPLRWREYMPGKPFAARGGERWLTRFVEQAGGEPLSSEYLRFIVGELKPFIDQNYPTLPEPAHTLVMGSSMGGLISLYALIEYPEIFGRAGCLSTHWPIMDEIMVTLLGNLLPNAGKHKLYFDHGTETLDQEYKPYQRLMDESVQVAGYEAGRDWLTRKFDGAEHSERAWRARISVPLTFLLGVENWHR
jgi:predicted alpha/beta superfamily hydrolase